MSMHLFVKGYGYMIPQITYVKPEVLYQYYIIYDNYINTLRPRQNGRHFADDIFKCIFLNENVWIPIKISLKFVPKGPINDIPALVQIIAWRRLGDKLLSEPRLVSLTTHICVIRPQWVNDSPHVITFGLQSNKHIWLIHVNIENKKWL